MVGGKHNVLVYYRNVCAPDPSDVVLCNPFIQDILWFILIKNHVICVHSTTADCNLFNNHRNRKLVGGNYNVLVYYKNANAPNPEGAVLCNTFKYCNLSNKHRNRKLVEGNYNVLVHYKNANSLNP
jgi:hypothetical protein